jgi:hypothetical protein
LSDDVDNVLEGMYLTIAELADEPGIRAEYMAQRDQTGDGDGYSRP